MNPKAYIIAVAAVFLMITSSAFVLSSDDSSADGTNYVDKEVPLVATEPGKPATVSFRVYEGKEYTVFTTLDAVWNIFSGKTMTVAKDILGKFTFTNPVTGMTAVFDPIAGTLYTENYQKFIIATSSSEDLYPFMNLKEEKVLKKAEPKTFDLRGYGIPYYADGDKVYFSLTTVNDILRTEEVMFLGYANGENKDWGKVAYFLDSYDILTGRENYIKYISEVAKKMVFTETRGADEIQFAYNELCMSWDCNYGKSETSKIGTAMQNDKLDHVLETYNSTTKNIREWLHAADNIHYYAGLYLFGMYVDDGGHTKVLLDLSMFKEQVPEFYNKIKALMDGQEQPVLVNRGVLGQQIIKPVRDKTWGDQETYHSKGDTAIYALDSFVVDKAAWQQYYDGGCVGPYPNDTVGNALQALDRAKADPNIKNFVFDYSCNTGGDAGAAVTILSIMFGDYSYLRYVDSDSGQMMYKKYMIDTNHDGVFDQRDLQKQYDFKFGIITTTAAYSCGNLVPVIAKQLGAVIIGERTGGGAHTVYVGASVDGFPFLMSSTNTMSDTNWKSVETGAQPDYVLVDTFSDNPDYSVLYDLDKISELMNKSDNPSSGNNLHMILAVCAVAAVLAVLALASIARKKA